MAIHEGRWDCTYCGNTGILGRYTTCTGCGRSRPEGVKFYLPDEESIVTEQKLLKLAEADADWICQSCDSSNRAPQTSCRDETYRDPVYHDEPDYQTWYTYEIEKWVLDHTAAASGDSQEVYWPEYTLAEDERARERSENYSVSFVDQEGQTYSQSFTYAEWLAYQPAEKHIAYVDFFGELTEIKPEG